MIRAVLGKLGLVFMLTLKLRVGTERHVFHDVRRLVNVLVFNVAVTGAELELETHDGRARNINQQAARAVF